MKFSQNTNEISGDHNLWFVVERTPAAPEHPVLRCLLEVEITKLDDRNLLELSHGHVDIVLLS